jgi:hypothetical protein
MRMQHQTAFVRMSTTKAAAKDGPINYFSI